MSAATELPPLLTFAEAGRRIRRSSAFIRREVHAERLTVTRVGRTPFISAAELARYLSTCQETGVAATRPGLAPAHKRVVTP